MADNREDLINRLAKVLYDQMKEQCLEDDEPMTEDVVRDAMFEYFDEVTDELTEAIISLC